MSFLLSQQSLNEIARKQLAMVDALDKGIYDYLNGSAEYFETGEGNELPKSGPALPLEVFHTVAFDANVAWEATRALARGQ